VLTTRCCTSVRLREVCIRCMLCHKPVPHSAAICCPLFMFELDMRRTATLVFIVGLRSCAINDPSHTTQCDPLLWLKSCVILHLPCALLANCAHQSALPWNFASKLYNVLAIAFNCASALQCLLYLYCMLHDQPKRQVVRQLAAWHGKTGSELLGSALCMCSLDGGQGRVHWISIDKVESRGGSRRTEACMQ
jgi:hypothetical protein